ncbi:hypothetical protein DFJ74DRAFT_450386 [Hyaloraphidium curvatum]|nr:hypothetical protein DFJ74DRAFT_450386 [Hyaloraphidium curvatum]
MQGCPGIRLRVPRNASIIVRIAGIEAILALAVAGLHRSVAVLVSNALRVVVLYLVADNLARPRRPGGRSAGPRFVLLFLVVVTLNLALGRRFRLSGSRALLPGPRRRLDSRRRRLLGRSRRLARLGNDLLDRFLVLVRRNLKSVRRRGRSFLDLGLRNRHRGGGERRRRAAALRAHEPRDLGSEGFLLALVLALAGLDRL